VKIEDIAKVAHELNRAHCQAFGDDSQKPWTEAPAWQRDSVVAGVIFHLRNLDATPAASHDAWLETKMRAGWKWGVTKDEEKKEHPNMVDFTELPREQRAKDFLFRQTVHSLRDFLDAGENVRVQH
jgi:hypothetical protein